MGTKNNKKKLKTLKTYKKLEEKTLGKTARKHQDLFFKFRGKVSEEKVKNGNARSPRARPATGPQLSHGQSLRWRPGPRGQQSFKYTPTARNPPAQVMPGQMVAPGGAPPPQQAVLVQGQEPLTASMLAAAPPQEQKQMLGERLFPLIQRMFPDLAGKITGMLLEIDNAELVHMLEDQNSLKGKVEEAVAVLQAHQGKAGDKK